LDVRKNGGFIWIPLIIEEKNSFKIIGTWAEQFSGMGNFAMAIWNSIVLVPILTRILH
jgi:hypothetical protein